MPGTRTLPQVAEEKPEQERFYWESVGEPKPRRDIALPLTLCAAILIPAIVIGMVVWATYYQVRYRTYISDLSASTISSYKGEGLLVRDGEETYLVTGDGAYGMYRSAVIAGIGKVCHSTPAEEPDMEITFSDGSYVQLWEVTISDSTNGDLLGTLVRYVNTKGQVYLYSTTLMRLHTLRILLNK